MPWARPRVPLVCAAVFDAVGIVLIAMLISRNQQILIASSRVASGGSIAIFIVIYCSLGWLFGSYTILKLRRVTWRQAIVRLAATSIGSFTTIALISYLFRLQISNSLFFRGTLIPLLIYLTIWSGIWKLAQRHLWHKNQQFNWQIIAMPDEISSIESEWDLSYQNQHKRLSIQAVLENNDSLEINADRLAISSGLIKNDSLNYFLEALINQGKSIHSIVEIAEQELQRIPPRWVGSQWLLFADQIDGRRASTEQQLKRYADALISFVLLLLTAPLVAVAALAVKLQDGGPIFYEQERTGLLKIPFTILKIRTMSIDAEQSDAQWSQPNDQRITAVGKWLRRTRVDELPQLLNVLKGDMSLIGPRPERPEIDRLLEKSIPNYTLRTWIRPGLSGWAQVNMPYASSIQDSEKKLGYDLFYIRNKNIGLDLLILLKTIKIVFKGAGR